MRDNMKNTIISLERNGFTVKFCETANDVKAYLLNEIDPSKSVGFGGSATLEEVGIYEALIDRGNQVFWHWKAKPGDMESRKEIMRNAMVTDIYLSGSNAVTEDGKLVNIDGTGNRLSSFLFGHEKLYMVMGMNKIVRNAEEAIIRIKNESCPKNAKRLGFQTPCAVYGKCMNCTSAQRFCNVTMVMERQHTGIPTTVVLVNEELGF